MEISTLRYVVTLAEELHFGRAAQRHFISAQPFGQHIQRIEHEIGTRLFERTSRRVQITRTGELFVDRARSILAQLDGLHEIAADAPPVTERSLRVGILGIGAGYRWPPLREAVRIQMPHLELAPYDLDFLDIPDLLLRREIDVAIAPYFGEETGVRFTTLFRTPRVMAVPACSDMAGAETLTRNDLADQLCLNVAVHGPLLETWLGYHMDTTLPAVRHPLAIPAAVAATGKMSLHVPQAATYCPRPDIRFIHAEGPDIEIAVATRDDDNRPAIQAFRRAAATVRELAITAPADVGHRQIS